MPAPTIPVNVTPAPTLQTSSPIVVTPPAPVNIAMPGASAADHGFVVNPPSDQPATEVGAGSSADVTDQDAERRAFVEARAHRRLMKNLILASICIVLLIATLCVLLVMGPV